MTFLLFLDTASIVVKINILDVNDNDPLITTNVADPVVETNEFPQGVVMFTYEASDEDSGDNGVFEFSVDSSDTDFPFEVTPAGELKVIKFKHKVKTQ